MAPFFEKLQAEGGSRAPQFLSDHPDPGNRVKAVEAEIQGLPRRTYTTSLGDFAREKSLVAQIPAPSGAASAGIRGQQQEAPVIRPSGGFKQVKGQHFALSYPDNWQVFG